MIHIPASFMKAAACVSGDIELYPTEMDLVVAFLSSVDDAERVELKAFIDELMSRKCSAAELNDIWSKTSASIYFCDDQGLPWLLSEAQKALRDFAGFVGRENDRLKVEQGIG